MLKAVIFDLNGLFVRSPEFLSARLERDFGVPEDTFIPILEKVLDQARVTKAPDTWPLWEPEMQKLGLKFTKEGWWEYWFKYEKEDISMLNLARELKEQKGLQVFILSNNFAERSRYYRENFSFAYLNEVVDKVYFSYETGFIKPNPEAWQNILRENDLKPEECIYFDNAQKNVDAAHNLGIKSYLFESPEVCRQKIEQFLK